MDANNQETDESTTPQLSLNTPQTPSHSSNHNNDLDGGAASASSSSSGNSSLSGSVAGTPMTPKNVNFVVSPKSRSYSLPHTPSIEMQGQNNLGFPLFNVNSSNLGLDGSITSENSNDMAINSSNSAASTVVAVTEVGDTDSTHNTPNNNTSNNVSFANNDRKITWSAKKKQETLEDAYGRGSVINKNMNENLPPNYSYIPAKKKYSHKNKNSGTSTSFGAAGGGDSGKKRSARGYSVSVDEFNLKVFRDDNDDYKNYNDIIFNAFNEALDTFTTFHLFGTKTIHKSANILDSITNDNIAKNAKRNAKNSQLIAGKNNVISENIAATTDDKSLLLDSNSVTDSINGNGSELMLERSESERDGSKIEGHCSFAEATFNMANYCLGGIILTIPYSMMEAGLSASLAIVLIGTLSYFTANLMDKMLDHYPQVSGYVELVGVTMGPRAKNVATCVVLAELYFYVILYFIFAGQLLHDSGYLELMEIHISENLCIIIMFVVILPTCFLNNLKPISRISSLGLAGVLATFFMLYMEAFNTESDRNFNDFTDSSVFFTSFVGFGYGIGSIFGSYSVHSLIPNIKASMKKPKQFHKVITLVWGCVIFAQLTISVFGYFAYGQDCEGLITSNFTGYYSYIASILLIAKSCSIPALCLYPIAIIIVAWVKMFLIRTKLNKNKNDKSGDGTSVSIEEIENTGHKEDGKSKLTLIEVFVRSLLILIALGFALIIPDFAFMANILGAITCLAMEFIFPTLMYVFYIRKQRSKGKFQSFSNVETIKCILCIVTFILMSYVCIWNFTSLIITYSS